MTTVLFVGGGLHQRSAIQRIRGTGVRVVAVDRDEDAPGMLAADVCESVDFTDVAAVTEVARRHAVDAVLTVSADRAVPVVAAVAEALGLPGIGTATARRMTHKRTMRDALAAAGVPQPAYAAVRAAGDASGALGAVSLPAVLKPVDSGGQRGVFRIDTPSDLELDLDDATAESATGEALLEEFVEGTELNGIVIARAGEPEVVTLSDRLRPPGIGFGVGWIHVYPPSIEEHQLREAEAVAVAAVRALGLRDGIAFPQLIAADNGRVVVVEVAARIPGGQMADLVRHAVGVDLVEIALRQALGGQIPDELARPRFRQPLAIRFFTAEPGPLPTGRVARIGSLEQVLAAEGVVQAETYLELGETIHPVRRDGDRWGYVIAVADTGSEALRRAESAAALLDVEVEASMCAFELDHYRELLDAARAGGYRFATFDEAPAPGALFLRHDVDFSLDAAVRMAEVEAEHEARATYLLMTESVFYNLASPQGVAASTRLRELGHRVGLHAVYPHAVLDDRFDPVVGWHNPDPEYMSAPIVGAVNVYADPHFSRLSYRSDSNQRWRAGCPHEELRVGGFPWLQLLVHPEIWFYPGATMGQTMRAMLDAERAWRLDQLTADDVDLA